MQQDDQQYQKLLTEIIKKQILILGPAITLAKVHNVKGITISQDGTVTAISDNPQELTRQLIDQFMELSSLIAKKTIEPILANYPGLMLSIHPDPAPVIREPAPSEELTAPANQPAAPLPAPLPDSTIANQKSETSLNH